MMMRNAANKKVVAGEVKNSMSMLLRGDPLPAPESPSKKGNMVLQLPADTIKKELEIYCWRFKTYLPIVKPTAYGVVSSPRSQSSLPPSVPCPPSSMEGGLCWMGPNQGLVGRQSLSGPRSVQMCELQVRLQQMKCRLSDINVLSLAQVVYLLKQMLIGYDALIDIFGTFEPCEEMVVVSGNHQWKVWINSDFYLNSKADTDTPLGEREFIYRLLVMAEKHCQNTSLSRIFFGQMKQYTFSNDCGFIRTLELIKEFVKLNKIFQVNKVTLPMEKTEKSLLDSNILNFKSATNLNSTLNLTNNYNNLNSTACFGRANEPPPQNQTQPHVQNKLKIDKKLTLPTYPAQSNERMPSFGMNRSSLNPTQQNFRMPTSPGSYLQPKPQKPGNHSSIFYYPPGSPPVMGNYQSSKDFSSFANKWNCPPAQPQSAIIQRPARSIFISPREQTKVQEQKKLSESPQRHQSPRKPQSPQPILVPPLPSGSLEQGHQHRISLGVGAERKPGCANMTKSRHQLKQLVNQTKEVAGPVVEPTPPVRAKKNQRKYSQQLFKAKSVDALTKKIRGSQFYNQDPQSKCQEVNVIKQGTPVRQKEPSSNNTTGKDPGSTTPNHSSNSTNELHHSGDNVKGKANYQYLKVNDLNNRGRNNQSSYYGMGGLQPKQNKIMTISYEFKNRNEARSGSSDASSKEQPEHHGKGNNWAKKISGLFSDDASIKHLKGSVKFKTAQEERFEKEYLKDVKLEMLEKFGRPVRHSIVDQEDDFRGRNPYKSMQLIEEVFDDEGKSYIQKEQENDREEEEMPAVRGRHQTMQADRQPARKSQYGIEQRECVSYECSERSEEQESGFNFESEPYVLNRH